MCPENCDCLPGFYLFYIPTSCWSSQSQYLHLDAKVKKKQDLDEMLETEVTTSFIRQNHLFNPCNGRRLPSLKTRDQFRITRPSKSPCSVIISIIMKVLVSEDITTEVQHVEPRCLETNSDYDQRWFVRAMLMMTHR